MGKLWDLYQEWRDGQQFPPSQRKVADRLEMSPTAFGNWHSQLSDMPRAENLARFAKLVRVPYPTVLDAALHDAGYLPRPEVELLVRNIDADDLVRRTARAVADEERASTRAKHAKPGRSRRQA